MDEPTVVEIKRPRAAAEAPILFGKRYRPIALLGTGGMGTVYLTRDEELAELVAVKMLRPEMLELPDMLERLRDEVRIARRVSSPFVARTHDLGEYEGRSFVTMQYVEGETLSARIRRDGRMSLHDVLPIARDLCDGLAAVHGAGVVHRDLKPANVLLSTDGRAVITDFGIALSVVAAGAGTDGSGTPTYTAPEQLAHKAVDARADIFSLGCILYTMVTGHKPFTGLRTGMEAPPDPRRVAPDLPDSFALLVMRAMARDPQVRFPSSDALKAVLDTFSPPQQVDVRDNVLASFVRSLVAGRGRKLHVTIALEGVDAPLGSAAGSDLMARLAARDQVQIAAKAEDAEAVLDAKLGARGELLVLDISLRGQADGYELLHESFECPAPEVPQLIERAAHAIESAFSPQSTALPVVPSYPTPEVARLMIEARAEYRGFWSSRAQKSVELFEQALALAPDHPLVLAWCATARARSMAFDGPDGPERERELAARAVALAPDLPEAHIALASAYMHDAHVGEAIPHFIAALRIAPGLVEQRAHFARILQECGAIEPAFALAQSLYQNDPTFTEPLGLIIRHHALRGRLDRAAEVLHAIPSTKDPFVVIAYARACFWLGDKDAFEKHRAGIDMNHLDPQPRLTMGIFAAVADGDASRVDELDKLPAGDMRRQCFFHQLRAEAYGFAREDARCIDAIEKAVALGLFDIHWLDGCQVFDALRGRVRFERLRRTVHERALSVLFEIERCLEPSASTI